MKKIILLLSLSACFINCSSHTTTVLPIKNAGFEDADTTNNLKPEHWRFTAIDHYQVLLDSTVAYKGNRSLMITNSVHSDQTIYQNFSQYCDYTTEHTKRVTITAYIKTKEVKGNVGIWCQLLDSANRKIGYSDLTQQAIKIDGTHKWTKYSILLPVTTQVKHLFLGGVFSGEGTAWFDHFEIEDNNDTTHYTQVANYIKEAEQIIKSNSLYRDSINWPRLDKDLYGLSEGVDSVSKASFLVSYMIQALRDAGDNHSSYQPKQIATGYKEQNKAETAPAGQYIGDNIAYIYVPDFLSVNDTSCVKFANSIQTLVKDIDTHHKVKGWIVDLRNDYGGNMYPMVAGLSPLIGSGTWWYFYTNAAYEPWSYQKVMGMVKLKSPYTLKNTKVKIAVLIGPHTASSGEMTAVSFIGKPNTKLFGQQSEGYTTINRTYTLSDSAFLNIATGYIADRNKKVYVSKLTPDFVIALAIANSNEDPTIDAAKEWILNNSVN